MHGKFWMRSLIFLLIAGFTTVAVAAEKGLSSKDKEFAKKAASGGMMEVKLGKKAQEKASSPDVKKFGQMMETEHGKANDELKTIAEKKNITLPKELESKHKSIVKKMDDTKGAEFDKAYMKEMVKDHMEDIEEFQKGKDSVKDPELKAWIEKTLPTLESHLKAAKETAAKVGVDVKKLEKK